MKLWLPAASKRSIHLHEGQQLAQLRLGDPELRREHSGVAVQHFQMNHALSMGRSPSRASVR
jgi:hypothetical protein